jgi:hypothetical protein
MQKFNFLILLFVLFLGACSNQSDKYLGRWQNVKNQSDVIEIVKNGDGFLLQSDQPNMFTGKREESKYPASMSKDGLKVENGFGGVVLSYVKDSDSLVTAGFMGSVEYKRLK